MFHQHFNFRFIGTHGLVFVSHDSVNLLEYEEVWVHTRWTTDDDGVPQTEAKLRRRRQVDNEDWGCAWLDQFGHTYEMKIEGSSRSKIPK